MADIGQVQVLSDTAAGGGACTCQAVPPLGPERSRYVFARGARANDGDERSRNAPLEVVKKAFAEDKAMIEVQQRVIDGSPGSSR